VQTKANAGGTSFMSACNCMTLCRMWRGAFLRKVETVKIKGAKEKVNLQPPLCEFSHRRR
jgi:hypothetical protein